MKKICLLLCIGMIMFAAGCNNNNDETEQNGQTSASDVISEAATQIEKAASSIDIENDFNAYEQ